MNEKCLKTKVVKISKRHFLFINFRHQAIYEIMQKSMVVPDRLQMTIIWCMHFLCWTTKTPSEYVMHTACTATIVMWTCFHIMLYILCLFCRCCTNHIWKRCYKWFPPANRHVTHLAHTSFIHGEILCCYTRLLVWGLYIWSVIIWQMAYDSVKTCVT